MSHYDRRLLAIEATEDWRHHFEGTGLEYNVLEPEMLEEGQPFVPFVHPFGSVSLHQPCFRGGQDSILLTLRITTPDYDFVYCPATYGIVDPDTMRFFRD